MCRNMTTPVAGERKGGVTESKPPLFYHTSTVVESSLMSTSFFFDFARNCRKGQQGELGFNGCDDGLT